MSSSSASFEAELRMSPKPAILLLPCLGLALYVMAGTWSPPLAYLTTLCFGCRSTR
jgi:hypothetical protein